MRRAAFALLLIAAAAPAAAQSVVFGVARDGSGFAYEYVHMPVWADMTASGGELLGSYTARITWDPAEIYYSGFETGTFPAPVLRTDSISYGILRLAAASPTGAGGIVDLGRIRFYGYPGGTSAVDISVTEASAAGSFTDLLPFVTTSSGQYCPALGRWGDVNGDGDANSFDALVVLSGVVGLSTGGYDVTLADVDGDGQANTRDALILLSYAVGIDIAGQRVLTVIPGPCAVAGATDIAVAPDSLDLVVGQTVPLRVTTRDSSGARTFVNAVNWVVDDPAVGGVDASDNTFRALTAGTTTLRAYLGPGIQVAVPVTVGDRRTTWHVDGAARSGVALGNSTYPFWTPQQAFPFVKEGDTIRVAPGIHDYDLGVSTDAYAGYVMIGDTLPDGTRPVLRAPDNCCYVSYIDYGGHLELRDLEFRNFDGIVYASGMRSVIMRNVLVSVDSGAYGFGVEVLGRPDTVDLEDVQMVADPATSPGDAVYLPDGAGLVRLVNVTMHDFSDGLYTGDGVDSIHVDGGDFRGLSDALGLYGGPGPHHAIYVANSRFVNNGRGIAGFEVERATLLNNVFDGHTSETVQLYAPSPAATTVVYRMIGDSVLRPDYNNNWIEADAFDSLLLEDVAVLMDTTYVYTYIGGEHATFRRTVLDGVHYEGFDLDVNTAVFDTVTVIGCQGCAFSGPDGIVKRYWSAAAGGTLTVNGGTFRRLRYAVYHPTNATLPGPVTMRDAVLDSVGYGLYAYADSVDAAGNVMTDVSSTGIYLLPSGDRPASFAYTVSQNHVRCLTTGTTYGVYLERTTTAFDGNFVEDCDYGLYAYTSLATILDVSFTGDSVFLTGNPGASRGVFVQNRWRPTLYGVRTRGGTYGADITTNDTGTVRVDSSAFSLSTTAGLRLALGTGTVATGLRNNIVDNVLDGILNSGTGTRSFTLGRFQNNGRWGVNSTPAFDAPDNWWGAASGPSSIGIADTVSGLVTIVPFLTVDPTDVPPSAPPAMSPGAVAADGAAPPAPAGTPPVPIRRTGAPPAPEAGAADRAAARAHVLEKKRSRPPPGQ